MAPTTVTLYDAITPCFDNSDYSDITIKCGDMSLHAHRVVVCTQSSVLRDACATGSTQAPTVIDMSDSHPSTVEIFLRYFYTHEYHEPRDIPGVASLHEVEEIVLTCILADKYAVLGLMTLMQARFKKHLSASEHEVEPFLSAVAHLYSMPSSASINAMRNIAVEYAAHDLGNCIAGGEVVMVVLALHKLREFVKDIAAYRGSGVFIDTNNLKGYVKHRGVKVVKARPIKRKRARSPIHFRPARVNLPVLEN